MMWYDSWLIFQYAFVKVINFLLNTKFFGLPFGFGYLFIIAVIFRVIIYVLSPAISTRSRGAVNRATDKHIKEKNKP